MPRPVSIRTDLAENALAQLALRAADHRVLTHPASTSPFTPRGRHLHDKIEMRHRNALTDLVAIAESFTTSRLMNLRPAVTPNDVGTWENRKKAWFKHATVDLAATHMWQPLRGFTEARNAIQHGLGRLTDLQLGKFRAEVLSLIASANLRLNGDMLTITNADVERCALTCVEFVRYLDLAAPQK